MTPEFLLAVGLAFVAGYSLSLLTLAFFLRFVAELYVETQTKTRPADAVTPGQEPSPAEGATSSPAPAD